MPPESSSFREQNPALSWEGDRMFNIYIYDYCFKRGFKKTARELMTEADLNDVTPPINARQGLLFEWWSVFWVLFQAKSGNSNNEEALLYMQHQNAQKAAQRMQAPLAQQQQPGVPMSLGNQPPQSSSNPQSQPQAPMRGMPNGMHMQRQPAPYHPNGPMPNGINPAMGGQPAQPGQLAQQSMQGQPGGLNFGGMGGQPNGLAAAQQPPPPQGGLQQLGTQTMSFNPMMGSAATQRPPTIGQPQQPGQQQPRGPFTSPPMAHSPQGGAAGGQPTSQGPPGQLGPQAPMAQLGPSPQMTAMTRSMLPPNGTLSASMGGPMNLPTPQQGAPPNTAFSSGPGPAQQGPQGQGPNPAAVRPPSRSRPTPSPSMSARQPPSAAGPQQQAGMGMMQMGPIQGMPGGINLGMAGGVGGSQEAINHEIMAMPHMVLSSLRNELGFGDKDLAALSMSEKMHILTVWKHRSGGGAALTPGVAGPSVPAQQARREGVPGMQGHGPGMLPPGQPQGPQQGFQIQQRSQQPQQPTSANRLKRNSTSPSEENEPRNESSPPDRKRMKRSPAQPPAVPPSFPQHHHPGQPGSVPLPTSTPQQPPMSLNAPPGQPGPGGNPQGSMTQQQGQMMMMRQQQPIGVPGASGSSGGQGGQGKPGGPPVAQTPTGPQPVGMLMHPGQMPPPQTGHFRGGPGPAPRQANAPQFHPTPLTQLGATKSHIGMPASSPGMNGPSKDNTKDNNKPQANGQPQGNQPRPDVSPRNTARTAPPTPGASNQPTPGLPPTSLPPPASASGRPGSQTPTQQQPSAMPTMLNMPMSIPGMPGMNAGDFMFEPALMESFDFDKADGDINFERDFGQWFSSTEDGSGLELR